MSPRLVLIVLTGVFVLVTTACGGGDTEENRFAEEGAPFAFSYPPTVQKVFADTGREIKGREPTYRVAFGTDETNVVVLATYSLDKDVAEYDRTDLEVAVQRNARALAKALDAPAPERVEGQLGDLPATVYTFDSGDGMLTTRLVYAFEGTTQYFLRCQWDAANQEVIEPACDEAMETFEPVAPAQR